MSGSLSGSEEELSKSYDESDELSESQEDNHNQQEEEDEQEKKKKIYTKDYDLHEIRISTTERSCIDVEPPVHGVLTDDQFYMEDGKPNPDVIKEHLRREGRISNVHLKRLINEVYELFCVEENVLLVEAPLTVCGDVHGQYYDLLKLFEVGGDPKTTRYLFLGDYVDRGNFSMECLILLYTYKRLYPDTFWMIRGNHECRHLTDYFTFKEECEYKYDIEIYNDIMDTFDAIPLVAIMNKQFFCVHGGLSPLIKTVEQIADIDRFVEPPPNGPMCDLLWSDPMDDFALETEEPFEFNSVRGCSWNYSYTAVCDFLERNKLLSVIRAHEAQDAGYRMYRRNDKTGFPAVITLFSAPNYLDSYNNKGAVLRYENNVINIRQFNHSPHPYHLPGFMNVFAWSLPFVAEKVGELLMGFFNLVDDETMDREEEEKSQKQNALRKKVEAVGRLVHLFKKIREDREQVLMAGQLSPNGCALPASYKEEKAEIVEPTPHRPLLTSSSRSLSVSRFEQIKGLDRSNEARPPLSPRSAETSTRPSMDSLKRRMSRDNIIYARRSSGEKLPSFQEIIKASHTTVTPDIKEEKV